MTFEDEENREVYEATMPAEGDIRYAIIVNQGIEELEDGRRPEGQPNFTAFTFKAGTDDLREAPSRDNIKMLLNSFTKNKS